MLRSPAYGGSYAAEGEACFAPTPVGSAPKGDRRSPLREDGEGAAGLQPNLRNEDAGHTQSTGGFAV